jgi:ABC-2 type transport system permease protein
MSLTPDPRLAPPFAAPRRRRIGRVNGRGLAALYRREVRRFLKVFVQTIGAPVVMSLLFFAIFDFALGDVNTMGGVAFPGFLAPGLMMMAMVQNAYANTSSSLLTAKMQGNIVDVLMPPLSPLELALGYTAGGVTRGLAVGVATGLALWCGTPLTIVDGGAVLLFAVLASAMLALAGLIVGIAADRFEQVSSVGNFLVIPLSFLSGTFYSLDALPAFWQAVSHANPFFYAIDGFRYGFIGHADADPALGAAVLLAVDLALFAFAWRLLVRGYRLKA